MEVVLFSYENSGLNICSAGKPLDLDYAVVVALLSNAPSRLHIFSWLSEPWPKYVCDPICTLNV